jgi:hypothetical protein
VGWQNSIRICRVQTAGGPRARLGMRSIDPRAVASDPVRDRQMLCGFALLLAETLTPQQLP